MLLLGNTRDKRAEYIAHGGFEDACQAEFHWGPGKRSENAGRVMSKQPEVFKLQDTGLSAHFSSLRPSVSSLTRN